MPDLVALSSRGRVVCDSCEVADTLWTRMRGLLGRRSLEQGEGLLLKPSGSVHTCFMQFPIDVVFLDGDMEVVGVSPAVPPWRIRARRGAKAVLELPAGEADSAGIRPGERLSVADPEGRRTPEADTEEAASAISTPAWRRPAVLALAGVLAAACILRYDADAHGFISALVVAVLVALAAADVADQEIPNHIVLPATALVLIAQIAFFPDRAAEWIFAGLGAAVFLAAPMLVRRDAVGFGDVKLALLIGVGLGWSVLSALTVGLLALFPVAGYMLLRGGAEARKEYVPLAPFLAFGAVVVILGGGAA